MHHRIVDRLPGYDGEMPKDAAVVAETLKQNGYNTAAFGKWHNTPDYETSPAGPFDRWPTGLGFEYFWGFMGGETNNWNPPLVENTAPAEKPRGRREVAPLRGDGREGDRVDRRAKGVRAGQAVLSSIGRPARGTLRITSPRNGLTSTKASSTTVGTSSVRSRSRPRRSLA